MRYRTARCLVQRTARAGNANDYERVIVRLWRRSAFSAEKTT